jgi:hypothetical protein
MLHDWGPVARVFLDFIPDLAIELDDGSSCSNRHVHPKLGQTGEATELKDRQAITRGAPSMAVHFSVSRLQILVIADH